MAGYSNVTIDGTLIEADRCRTPGPTPGVDLLVVKHMTTTAGTYRSSPPRTAGRSGHHPYAPAGNTTPPPCVSATSCHC